MVDRIAEVIDRQNELIEKAIEEVRKFRRTYAIMWLIMFGGFIVSFTLYWIVRYGLK